MPGIVTPADFPQRGLQLSLLVVLNAAVFDVQAVEALAIALVVPSQVVVKAGDIIGLGRRQRLTHSIPPLWP